MGDQSDWVKWAIVAAWVVVGLIPGIAMLLR